MWLFTKIGFFSVVKCDDRKPLCVTVRARVREHLEALGVEFRAKFKSDAFQIIENPTADYRYRAFMTRCQWSRLARRLSCAIDYGNFKSAVEPGRYHDAMYAVWTTMRRLQEPGDLQTKRSI
jgi:hypothetical protein